MLKMRNSLALTGLLLSLLIITPQFIAATLTAQIQTQPRIISVETKSSVRTITAFGMTFSSNEFIKIEKWTNGTKAYIEERMKDLEGRNVTVTCTTWLNTTIISQKSEATPVHKILGYYPGKYCDPSSDWLWFLRKGNNGTHFVSYDHPDNYDYYYPQEWYRPYYLPDAKYLEPRAQKIHVHYPKDFIEDWINGIHDKYTACAVLLGAMTVVGEISLAILSAVFGCPLGVIPCILGAIGGIFEIILTLLGYTEERYVRDVVMEKFSGDGWAWRDKTMAGYDYYGGHRDPFWTKAITCWDYYAHREWDQSWGSEGVFGSQHYTADYYTHSEIKTGGPPTLDRGYYPGVNS